MADKDIDEATGVSTTGHEWDGIRELNNPMPRWWLWTFYATIVWALIYSIAYPAWPMLTSATKGWLGYSSRAAVREDLNAADLLKADYREAIAAKPLAEIVADEKLRTFAVAAGAAAFKVNCIQCHGTGAQGSAGFPISMTTTGSGAASLRTFTQQSCTASASPPIPTPVFPKCRNSARS